MNNNGHHQRRRLGSLSSQQSDYNPYRSHQSHQNAQYPSRNDNRNEPNQQRHIQSKQPSSLSFGTEGHIGHKRQNYRKAISTGNMKESKKYPIFDMFLDLPHPAASPASSSSSDKARVIMAPQSSSRNTVSTADELCDPNNITRISRFCFPEHDEHLHAASLSFRKAVSSVKKGGANLNKHDVYCSQFHAEHFTFMLQLSSGERIHGHVRRYLPTHAKAPSRYDIGRRCPRAMAILTRASCGERFYATVLKTIESIYTVRDSIDPELICGPRNRDSPEQKFLNTLYESHQKLHGDFLELQCRSNNIRKGLNGNFVPKHNGESNHSYGNNSSPSGNDKEGTDISELIFQDDKFAKLDIEGVEFGPQSPVLSLDKMSFHLPPTLQPGFKGYYSADDIHSPIIPLLRCLGASHMSRLLSALLCERRIIMISRYASRLSSCIRGASSMIAQGLLIWQHMIVPILPSHLLKYLAAKTPYLIGILEASAQSLELIPGMGEVLCINLDSNTMVTYFMPNPTKWIPDLLHNSNRRTKTKISNKINCCELLAQHFEDILKADRRSLSEACGIAVSTGGNDFIGNTHNDSKGKNNTGVCGKKSLLSRFLPTNAIQNNTEKAEKNSPYQRSGVNAFRSSDMSVGDGTASYVTPNGEQTQPHHSPTEDTSHNYHESSINRLELNCCENEQAEEDIRIALVGFFLYLFGDMGTYLSESSSGGFWLDRKKFLQCKLVQGVEEDSNLFRVLMIFSRTLLFQKFVKSRIYELNLSDAERSKCPLNQKSLFSMCDTFMRTHGVECSIVNIRKVVQQHSQLCPQRDITFASGLIWGKVLSLTSNQNFEGNALKALASIIKNSLEVNGALCHIMGVIWSRMKDTRSGLWRHPLLALYVLRNLLLHGPLTAITEACDGINKIYELRSYFASKNSESALEVRTASDEIYHLLTSRTELLIQRRHLASRRLKLNVFTGNKSEQRWVDYLVRRLPITVGFSHIHELLRPASLPVQPTRERFVTEYYDDEKDSDLKGHTNNEEISLVTADTEQFNEEVSKQYLDPETSNRSISPTPVDGNEVEEKKTSGEIFKRVEKMFNSPMGESSNSSPRDHPTNQQPTAYRGVSDDGESNHRNVGARELRSTPVHQNYGGRDDASQTSHDSRRSFPRSNINSNNSVASDVSSQMSQNMRFARPARVPPSNAFKQNPQRNLDSSYHQREQRHSRDRNSNFEYHNAHEYVQW